MQEIIHLASRRNGNAALGYIVPRQRLDPGRNADRWVTGHKEFYRLQVFMWRYNAVCLTMASV